MEKISSENSLESIALKETGDAVFNVSYTDKLEDRKARGSEEAFWRILLRTMISYPLGFIFKHQVEFLQLHRSAAEPKWSIGGYYILMYMDPGTRPYRRCREKFV
jgi:hypothetical protein